MHFISIYGSYKMSIFSLKCVYLCRFMKHDTRSKMCNSNETWSICLHPSSAHNPYSAPLNLQLVCETPAVAFNWVGDVTKLSSGLCVCTRARVEDERERVCWRQRVRALLWTRRGFLFFGEWIVRFASESKRFGIVDKQNCDRGLCLYVASL